MSTKAAVQKLGKAAASTVSLFQPISRIAPTVGAEAYIQPLAYTPFNINIDSLKTTLLTAPKEGTAAGRSAADRQSPRAGRQDAALQRAELIGDGVRCRPLIRKSRRSSRRVSMIRRPPHGSTTRRKVSTAGHHAARRGTSIHTTSAIPRRRTSATSRPITARWSHGSATRTEKHSAPICRLTSMSCRRSRRRSREYRVAIGATGEYTAFQGGTQALALAAITTVINRITGVYETDFAIRMTLVANETNVIYTNARPIRIPTRRIRGPPTTKTKPPSTTPRPASADANYDFGHVFYKCAPGNDNGLAGGIGTVGTAGIKGKGTPHMRRPSVIRSRSTTSPTRWATNSVVVTRSTTAAAARATAAASPSSRAAEHDHGLRGHLRRRIDLQAHSDPYFASINYEQIIGYTTSGGGGYASAVKVATGNTAPTIGVLNGITSYTIPRRLRSPSPRPARIRTAIRSPTTGNSVTAAAW